MKRRFVIKQLAFITAGSFLATSNILKGCAGATEKSGRLSELEKLLASVAETIIPKTDTPGADELNVHLFVMRMVNDCYDVEAQDRFVNGTVELNQLSRVRYGQNFENSSSKDRLALLTDIQDKEVEEQDVIYFVSLMKKLTLQGYLNSEYVMTNLIKYELVPGRYNGYFPVKAT